MFGSRLVLHHRRTDTTTSYDVKTGEESKVPGGGAYQMVVPGIEGYALFRVDTGMVPVDLNTGAVLPALAQATPSSFGRLTSVFRSWQGTLYSIDVLPPVRSSHGTLYAIEGRTDSERQIRSWDLAPGHQTATLRNLARAMQTVISSVGGDTFFLTVDGWLQRWSTLGAMDRQSSHVRPRGEGADLVVAPDGSRVVVEGPGDDLIDASQLARLAELRGSEAIFPSRGVLDAAPVICATRSGREIHLWGSDGTEVGLLQGDELRGARIALTPGSRYLVSASAAFMTIWSCETGQQLNRVAVADHSITALTVSADGARAAAIGLKGTLWASLPELRVVGDSGHQWPGGTSARFSPTGKRVLASAKGNRATLFDSSAGNLLAILGPPDTAENSEVGFQSACFDRAGKLVLASTTSSTWLFDAEDGHLVGRLEGGFAGERCLSADGWRVVTSTNAGFCCFDLRTRKPLVTSKEDGVGTLLGFAAGDRHLISVLDEIELRVWDASSGDLLATSVALADGGWVTFTPSYHYVASFNGDDAVQMLVGNQAYPLSCYRRILNSEDIVDGWLAGKRVAPAVLSTPPELEIVSPQNLEQVVHERRFTLTARAQDRYGIEGFEVSVDGGELEASVIDPSTHKTRGSREASLNQTLSIPEGRVDMTVSVRALNVRQVLSRPRRIHMTYEPPAQDLYVVAVGVASYDDHSQDLRYPVNDVTDLTQALMKQQGSLFNQVHVQTVVNESVTAGAINRLRETFLLQAKPEDTIVVFLAGHGVRTASGDYYFLTSPASGADPFSGVDRETLEKLVTWPKLHAKRRLMLIDTCQAGVDMTDELRGDGRGARLLNEADVDKLREASGNGLYIIAATSDESYARESEGNGMFTRAILDGLAGKADSDKNGLVEIDELTKYVRDQVHERSGGRQRPTVPKVIGGENFPIARVAR